MADLIPLLIDPELIHPAEQFENDATFLRRLCYLAEYRNLYIGPSSKTLLNDFLLQLVSNPKKSMERFNQLGPNDPISIFAPLFHVGDTSNWKPGAPLSIASCGYTPRFGAPDNTASLQSDVDAVNVSRIALITDEICWPQRTAEVICEDEPLRYIHCLPCQKMHWRTSLLAAMIADGCCKCLGSYTQNAFPALIFSDEAIRSFTKLKAGAHDDGIIAFNHLAALNDHAPAIWEECMDRNERIARMSALGVVCSPESSQTHSSKRKMKQRDYIFDGKPIRCEWHTKLHHNFGRIHFRVEADQVYIGAFEHHLET